MNFDPKGSAIWHGVLAKGALEHTYLVYIGSILRSNVRLCLLSVQNGVCAKNIQVYSEFHFVADDGPTADILPIQVPKYKGESCGKGGRADVQTLPLY